MVVGPPGTGKTDLECSLSQLSFSADINNHSFKSGTE
jgi:MoxR-like ATPase